MKQVDPVEPVGQPVICDLSPELLADSAAGDGGRALPLPSDPKTVFLGGNT